MQSWLMMAACAAALAFTATPGVAAEDIADEADAAASIEPAATNAYQPVGATSGMSLGKMIASRITDPSLSEFKKALETAEIKKPYDPNLGYTVFAPINGEFDPKDHPMDHYIINNRVSLNTMTARYDTIENISGDDIRMHRTANKSYFVDDMRVNQVDRNPEGTILKVGGWQDAPHL